MNESFILIARDEVELYASIGATMNWKIYLQDKAFNFEGFDPFSFLEVLKPVNPPAIQELIQTLNEPSLKSVRLNQYRRFDTVAVATCYSGHFSYNSNNKLFKLGVGGCSDPVDLLDITGYATNPTELQDLIRLQKWVKFSRDYPA